MSIRRVSRGIGSDTRSGLCFLQVGFFKMIALPLFTAWCKAFPECQPLLDQVQNP